MPLDPIELLHSWPLFEEPRHFEMGHILNCAATDVLEPTYVGQVGLHHAGCWECDLRDDSLVWSGGVYDIFGLPRGEKVTRNQAILIYSENSRLVMNRLRTYAIRHRRGFTLDAEICPTTGGRRWIRLIAAPVCGDEGVERLHGVKFII